MTSVVALALKAIITGLLIVTALGLCVAALQSLRRPASRPDPALDPKGKRR